MLKFNYYRINLTTPPDLEFFVTKEKRFLDVLEGLSKAKKGTFRVRNTKYILYCSESKLDGVYFLQLAKEGIHILPTEGEEKIEDVAIMEAQHVWVIVDVKRQIIMMQEKTTVFQDIEVGVDRLQYYFTEQLASLNIAPLISPITDKKDFWEFVGSAEAISEFDVTLNGPNLFKGRFKAEELIQAIDEEFNISEVTIQFKNILNQLTLKKDGVAEFIALAAAGAGKYTVKAIKNGKRVVLKSYEFVKKKVFDLETPLEIDLKELEDDLKEIDKLNEDEK